MDVRDDFPIIGERELVYLDSAATSQKPGSVIEAIDDFYRRHNANIHRGVYDLAAEATELFEGARARVADFTGDEVATTIFTRNATEALNLVAYAWTGHKALGPTGIGVLHGRRELLEEMSPFLGGGDMIRTVEFERSTWNELPWKFEAGTSMIAEGVGLGAAVDYLRDLGMPAVREHERELTGYALDRLAEVDGVRVLGPPAADDRGGVISFEVDGMHPHDVAELLNRDRVCVRAGHHCAQPLMRRLGVPATARASFAPYTVASDVDAFVESLARARAVFA